jgi:hypothetical protein
MGQNKHSTTPDDVLPSPERIVGLALRSVGLVGFLTEDDEPAQALDPAGAARWAWRLLGSGLDPRQVEALKSGPSLGGLIAARPCERPGATEPGDCPDPLPRRRFPRTRQRGA